MSQKEPVDVHTLPDTIATYVAQADEYRASAASYWRLVNAAALEGSADDFLANLILAIAAETNERKSKCMAQWYGRSRFEKETLAEYEARAPWLSNGDIH